ncbi:hypothetical protein B0A75_04730 [Flavobacterium oncorhynchi]|uniref:Uncharacterized protein n=1 Tax=Flavobacterium oncorhynchi TaxID=728056 RepID=A0A226I5F9_9FLAO|nr:hypothetical protein [Flavobacterium oncorhynchi]OXB01750.1 hypothetical protein B0A75_04730 [Flavobacterium oncorhynchi]
MALGEFRLKVNYFYSLTPREFVNTERGIRKHEEILSQERWIMTRKIMWATAFPHLKRVTEHDLQPFPWDEIEFEGMSVEESKRLQTEAEKVKEFYRKQDEIKKSQSI